MDSSPKYSPGHVNGPWAGSSNARLYFNVAVVIPGCITAPLWYFLLVYLPLKWIHATLPSLLFQVLVTCLAMYLVQWVVSELRKPESDPRDSIPVKPKKVGIIGGGISGLVLAKELLDEGHEVMIFEKNSEIGGVWKVGVGPGVMETTISSSSSTNTALSDLYLPQYFPENYEPFHVTQQQFMDYIQRYAEKHNLLKYLHLGAVVEKITPMHNGQDCCNGNGKKEESAVDMPGCCRCYPEDIQWEMCIREGDKVTSYVVDHVGVCTGQANSSNSRLAWNQRL